MQHSREETNRLIGQRIKSLRLEKGMSVETLAESSGLSSQTIKQIERGVRSCNVWSLICIADVLLVSIQHFLQFEPIYLPNDLKVLIDSMTPLQLELSKNLLYAVKMTKLE